jgi:hypothetical protein
MFGKTNRSNSAAAAGMPVASKPGSILELAENETENPLPQGRAVALSMFGDAGGHEDLSSEQVTALEKLGPELVERLSGELGSAAIAEVYWRLGKEMIETMLGMGCTGVSIQTAAMRSLTARESADEDLDRFLAVVGTDDKLVDQATALGTVIGSQVSAIQTGANLAQNFDAATAATTAGDGVGATLGAAETIGMGALGVVTGAAGLVSASITLHDKRTKNEAYKAHNPSMEKPTKESNKDPKNVEDIARYAFEKNIRAMAEAWLNVFQALVTVASGVLTIIGAAVGGVGAVVGLALGAANIGVKALRGAARWGKALFKIGRGTRGKNRATNAEKLVQLATAGDEEAAEMLLQMDVSMIVGGIGHNIRRFVHKDVSPLMQEEESLKNADGKNLTKDADPSSLIEVLETLQAKMGEDGTKEEARLQYQGLLREIQQAMRSVV